MKKQRPEIYISTDIESNGPIPGEYSMLSFASAAFTREGNLLGTFTANLELLEGAKENPSTMKFWEENQDAYNATRTNLKHPEKAMKDYLAWAEGLPGKPVFVGYPVTFDFMFVYWYLMRFCETSPFSHSALDIKTLAMVALKTDYRAATKRNMPRRWFNSSNKHTHVALDDAIEQGELFVKILKELEDR